MKAKGQRILELQCELKIIGDWKDDDIAASILALEVKANGISGGEALPSQRVHIFEI